MKCHPLTSERWPDFVKLFGEKGACGGCWCMWWRLTNSRFQQQKGAGNKRAMKAAVNSGDVPGILAYAEGRPVGWCAFAPRENYPRLARSRILSRVDDSPVWSIVCFYVDKSHRGNGVTVHLLNGAIDYVGKQGGKIVEGYPVDPRKGPIAPVFAYHGLASAFRKAGFSECARRSATRPVMRFHIPVSRHSGAHPGIGSRVRTRTKRVGT